MINKIITFILLISTILMSGCSVLSIINRPPVIDEFYLSKYVAYTGEPINASFKYNDPDGDNVYVSIILQKGVQSQYLISNTMLPSTTNVTYQFYIFYSGSYDLILELDDGKGKTAKTNTVSLSDSSTYDMTI
ncbi:MAG: hypothetical protein RMJ37_07965, partial [Spirochaetia bacterium]|nr:hypothetical protein [Spirochaetota bacterium]MDW8113249.1 hypothetical protein [Spirochaetia bacterium]